MDARAVFRHIKPERGSREQGGDRFQVLVFFKALLLVPVFAQCFEPLTGSSVCRRSTSFPYSSPHVLLEPLVLEQP